MTCEGLMTLTSLIFLVQIFVPGHNTESTSQEQGADAREKETHDPEQGRVHTSGRRKGFSNQRSDSNVG